MLNKTKAQDILNKMFNTSGAGDPTTPVTPGAGYDPTDYEIEGPNDINYTVTFGNLSPILSGTIYVKPTNSTNYQAITNAAVFVSNPSNVAQYSSGYGVTYNANGMTDTSNTIKTNLVSPVNDIIDGATSRAYGDGASSGSDPNGVHFNSYLYLGLFKTVPDEFAANGVEADYAKYVRKKVVGFYYNGPNGESVPGAYRAVGDHGLPYFPPAVITHHEVLDDSTTDMVADIMNQEEIALAVNSDVVDSSDGHTVITPATTCRIKGFGLFTSATGTTADDLLMWGPVEPELNGQGQPIVDGSGDAYVDILRNETPMFYTSTFRVLIK